jgi:hypothetical protein
MQNLLAYWVGSLMAGVPYALVPIMVLHSTPMFTSFSKGWANPGTVANLTVRHIQIGIGVLFLSIAAMMTVRSLTRTRGQARVPTPGGSTSTLVLDSNTPTATSRLPGRAQNAATAAESATRRLLARAYNTWENGSLWVPFGLGLTNVPIDSLLVAPIIVASGAAIGAQVCAAIAFVVGWLATVEIILVTYLAAPEKTQAVLRRLHDAARAHRRKILVVMFAVVGVSLVASGMGIIWARG